MEMLIEEQLNFDGPIVEVKDLKVHFVLGTGIVHRILGGEPRTVKAVDGVSVSIKQGEILGLVGESGCGKTTTGMALVGLYASSSGEILFDGNNLKSLKGKSAKAFRKKAQIIFQNPYESLNPRFNVFNTVAEMLAIYRVGRANDRNLTVARALVQAGLRPPESYFNKLPHELSGGERQRVAIARAIILSPKFIVADEPVSMLDVSVRAGILNLIRSLSEKSNVSILYISHDLASVRYICNRIAIMYLGKIVELGDTDTIINDRLHPYSNALVSSIPVADPDVQRERVAGTVEVPTPVDLPPGCRYAPRCPHVMDECRRDEPGLREVALGHWVRCYLYE